MPAASRAYRKQLEKLSVELESSNDSIQEKNSLQLQILPISSSVLGGNDRRFDIDTSLADGGLALLM